MANDAYYTPLPLAEEMLRLFEEVNGGPPATVLEPSAGAGVFLEAANMLGWEQSKWVCFEKTTCSPPIVEPLAGRELAKASWCDGTDFLDPELNTFGKWWIHHPGDKQTHDLCVGNPPFSLAEEFVRKALKHADQVMFLLRAGFLASKKRHSLFVGHPPANVWMLSQRPSFTGNGTDSAEYCVIHWGQCTIGETRLRWLPGGWR